METVTHSERLAGRASAISAGVFSRTEATTSGEIRLETEALLAADGTFREQGTISFADGRGLRLRTLGTGLLVPGLTLDVRIGTVTWDLDGGTGRWEHASGRICSTFSLSVDGEVVDDQHGLIVLAHHVPLIGGRR